MTKEQFLSITQWQKETFPNATPLSKAHHLAQEVGELIEGIEYFHPATKYEYADCFILLFGSAAAGGMTYEDICSAIDEKMAINKKRKWGNPDENGVVNHI